MKKFDFVIAGAGIIGLTIARVLAQKKSGTILVLEKEPALGLHASGRNSGVLHSGIYYAADSLKARFCATGSRMLQDYAAEHKIEMLKTGKVIVAQAPELVPALENLYLRALENKVRCEKISPSQLKAIEPEAETNVFALYSPDTAIIDSSGVLQKLKEELIRSDVQILFSSPVSNIKSGLKTLRAGNENFQYGHFINASGLHADRIAHSMGVGEKYRILPFKGLYRYLKPEAAKRFRSLIYPTPDPLLPFLGVHTTRTLDGHVKVGPTAIPAFGRENYGILKGLDIFETPRILTDLFFMLLLDSNNMRILLRDEFPKYHAQGLINAVQKLAPGIKETDLSAEPAKVGIRAQLADLSTRRFIMDFVIEKGPASTHILNAVSPAFTASMSFAEFAAARIFNQE